MSNGPVEPRADFRHGAAGLYELFVALREAGFGEGRALTVVSAVVAGVG